MTKENEWGEVIRALDRLDGYVSLRPRSEAMRSLVSTVRREPGLKTLRPAVSHTALVFGRESSAIGVWVWWTKGDQYKVAVVDSELTTSDEVLVSEERVPDVLRGHVRMLEGQ